MDIIEIVKNNLDKKYINKYRIIRVIWRKIYAICSYIKSLLYKLISKQLQSKCVLINSAWGTGKTYRFKHNLQPVFEDNGYRCVYISLFGIKNIDEFKIKLINICLNYKYKIFLLFFIPIMCFLICTTYGMDLAFIFDNKIIFKSFSPFYICIYIMILWIIFKFMKLNFIKTILVGLSNKFLGTGIPMNKSEIGELFNPYRDIFIFDDFERVSDDCNIKEIIGFIADLKYIHGFNILIISDENNITNQHKKYYNLYKEKLIDYEENEIFITEDIFNSIIHQIKDERVKEFAINTLTLHMPFNSITETPIIDNLRVILKCIDDIKILFKNKLLNDDKIYWITNYENSLSDILKSNKETIFIKNSKIEDYILDSLKIYYKNTLSEDELKKEENSYLYIEDAKHLSNITDEEIKTNFYKNKLQILNDYCCIYIEDDISVEITNQIIDNLIDCKDLLNYFGTDFENYIRSFKTLCFYLNKDISNYFDLFRKIIKNILNNYYNNFYRLSNLCHKLYNNINLYEEIGNILKEEITNYKNDNGIKLFKEKLQIIDDTIGTDNKNNFDNDICHLLNEFFLYFSEICIKNENVFEEIDFNSYKNSKKIKIYFIKYLYSNLKAYFGNFNKQEIIDMLNRLSKFYCSEIEQFRFNSVKKQAQNL